MFSMLEPTLEENTTGDGQGVDCVPQEEAPPVGPIRVTRKIPVELQPPETETVAVPSIHVEQVAGWTLTDADKGAEG